MLVTAILQHDCRELEHLLQRARRQLLWLGVTLLAWYLELQVCPRRDMLVIVSIKVVEQRQPLVEVALHEERKRFREAHLSVHRGTGSTSVTLELSAWPRAGTDQH